MNKLTKRLASGLLTALMLVTSLPVDSLAKSVSTISNYANDSIHHGSDCRNFVDSKLTDQNLTFDLAGDAEGQSIMTKSSNTTHGNTKWYFHQAGTANSTISPGELTSDGGVDGSGKYLKLYGDSFFQMGTTLYAVTNATLSETGYQVSFDYKSEVSSQESPNAFFFRCDSDDAITYRDGKDRVLYLYESDKLVSSYSNDPFIGGSGIALWVSGKHTLTLVLKKVHTGYSAYVDNEFIDFYVEEDLTSWNNYRIVDTGRKHNATTTSYDYYTDQAEIYFYLNGKLIFNLQCLNYGNLGRTQRTANYHASGDTDDKGVGLSFTSSTTDTDYFFRSCIVKDAGGMTIKTVDGSLIRNYSRMAFVSRMSGAAMGIDNVNIMGVRDNGDKISGVVDYSDIDSYNTTTTDGAIYLPITIRDYNNDGMLFEYNDQWNGNLDGITLKNKADVVRGGVSGGKASAAPGFTQQINTLMSGTYTPATSFSSLLNISSPSVTNASWTHITSESETNLSIYGTDYYRMVTTAGDPQANFTLSGDNRVTSSLVAGYAVRYRTTVTNTKMRVYYVTDDASHTSDWGTGTSVSGTLVGDGKWHNAYIPNVAKDGKITNLRLDFIDSNSAANQTIDIKYVMIVGKHTPLNGENGTVDIGESFTSTVSTDTDSYYPYYTFTQGFSKSTKYIGGVNASLKCSDYRYALVRYKTTTANQKITVSYYNGSTLSATSGEKLVYSDGQWHDLFVRVGSSSTDSNTFTAINVEFNGNIDIIQITPLKYVRFTGTATYGYTTDDLTGTTICRDEDGNKLVYLDKNNVNIGDDATNQVYYANVKYKTTASKLTMVIKTHNSYEDKYSVKVSFDTRGDGKWHTAAVPVQTGWLVGQIYFTCDDDKYYLTVSEVVFFHYNKTAANKEDLCKFYATYYNPKYEYSNQLGNNLAFGLLVYQNPDTSTSVEAFKYYGGFKSGDPTYYFGKNHRTDATDANNATSGNRLPNAHSYGIGTSYSAKGYLTFKSLDAQYGEILIGCCTQCLTTATLNANGKPEYQKDTVMLLASLIAYALRVGMTGNEEDDAYGFYNRVVGEVNDELFGAGNDFASFIRSRVLVCTCTDGSCLAEKNGNTSPYYFSSQKHYKIGWYDSVVNRRKAGNCTLEYFKTHNVTCLDIAFYMLDNLYVSGQDESGKIIGNGYSMEISEYDSLALIQTKDQNGNNLYTFSSARSNTEYDTTNRVIYNTQTVREPYFKNAANKYQIASGHPYYDYMFNPLGTGRNYSKGIKSNNATALGYGDTDSKYLANDGVSSYSDYGDRYTGYNYNFSMEGSAQFVYHEEDNLFFRFMGDDDVYLYIDGKLILDIGGAHSRCDTEVYLNEANIKHNLGLVEGETYTFKFFYMERHGFAANFSIQTNIRLTDPSMPVDKIGYVSGDELAYGDNVQKTDIIEYEFTATCLEGGKSDSLQYFYFDDNDLGFELGYTAADSNSFVCNLGTYSDAKIARLLTDLSLFITNADGSTAATCADMSESGVKAFLAREVTAGQTIHLKGVKHKLTEAQVNAMTFKNLVNISSYYSYGGFYHKLDANGAFLVNVSELVMYLWAGHDRTYNFADLLTDNTNIGDSTYGAMKSSTIGVYISDRNKNAITNTSHSITSGTALSGEYAESYDLSTAKGKSNVAETGVSTFYFTLIAYVSGTDTVEKLGPFGVKVYTYDVSDANYVLDYGLPVVVCNDPGASDTHGTSFISLEKDTLTLSSNTNATYDVYGFANSFTYNTASGKLDSTGSKTYTGTGNYGTFAGGKAGTSTENMTYTPNKFIQGVDSVQVAVGVYTNRTDDFSIRTGVQMYKNINFMPASIMYYEENIGSISYKQGMTTGTAFTTGKTQSANQNESYGYDEAYSNNETTTSDITQVGKISWWGGKKVITRLGSGGFDGVGNNYNFSNGTYAKLDTRDVNNYKSPVASFDFTGTGFELISYTNYASATVRVDVIDKGSGTKVKGKLVITTYGQGSLNQVPIIDIDGLTYDEYTVNIYVIKPLDDGRGVMFYLDGVRIYNPTTDKTITDNYKTGEAGATVEELRADILKNNNTVAVLNQKLGQKVTFTVGQSYVERVDGNVNGKGNTWNFADSTGKFTYENVGPNNEIYLKSQVNALVFRVKPTDVVDNVLFEIEAKMANGVQIAWRDCTTINSNGEASFPNAEEATANGYPYVDSYTSRYYAMDVSKCIENDDGTYTVIVLFNTPDAIVSLTNVKYSGCTLEPINIDEMITENGVVAKTAAGQLLSDVMAVMDSINEGYEVNEDLVINSVTTAAAYEAEEDVIVKVSASADAETVYVLDSDGNEVEVKSVKSVAYGDNVMFTVNLGALSEGTYSFTFDVADSDGRTCADTVTKTITVEE